MDSEIFIKGIMDEDSISRDFEKIEVGNVKLTFLNLNS